jgi:hypothetical protein
MSSAFHASGIAAVHTPRKPLGDLLQEPAVAVRVAEGGIGEVAAPFGIPAVDRGLAGACPVKHLAHLGAAPDELCPRRLDVGDSKVEPARRARRGAAVIPVPKWIEAGEPGGVNCTTRKLSLTGKSASNRQPRPL